MPGLINLNLEDSIPHDSGGPSPYPVVDLPCLRVLHISSCVDALTTALHYITFPSSIVLNLTCKETQATSIDFLKFLSVLATKFLSSLVIRSLSLQDFFSTVVTQNGLRFLVWTTATRDFFLLDFPSPPQLKLGLTWPTSSPPHRVENNAKALTAVFDDMNLFTLTQLHLSTPDCIDSQIWLETFGKLPQLKWVDVFGGDTAQSFLGALVYKTEAADKSKSAYRNVSFPKLRHINLQGIDFAKTNLVSIDMLMDCLMERYERNAEIQMLRLMTCCILKKDVERLEEIVVDVIWEGHSD